MTRGRALYEQRVCPICGLTADGLAFERHHISRNPDIYVTICALCHKKITVEKLTIEQQLSIEWFSKERQLHYKELFANYHIRTLKIPRNPEKMDYWVHQKLEPKEQSPLTELCFRVLSLYGDGKSFSQISRELDLHTEVIRRQLRKAVLMLSEEKKFEQTR